MRSIYEIRQKQWPQQQAQSAHSSGTTVMLTYPDGTIEKRTGNRPQRDNNPGNISARGEFAAQHGSVGTDKNQRREFAIFPSAEAGWEALDADLRTSKYWNLSIDHAIAIYAPKEDGNNTERYQNNVRNALGLPGDTKISSLTPAQFETLKQRIAEIEGFYENRPNKKVRVVIQIPKKPDVIPRN